MILPQKDLALIASSTLQAKEAMYTTCAEIYGPLFDSGHPPPDKAFN
jgi:hypothetical protein